MNGNICLENERKWENMSWGNERKWGNMSWENEKTWENGARKWESKRIRVQKMRVSKRI